MAQDSNCKRSWMRGVDLDARGLFCIQACFHSRFYTGKGGGEPLARTSRQPDLSPAYHLRANCKFCGSYCSYTKRKDTDSYRDERSEGGGRRTLGTRLTVALLTPSRIELNDPYARGALCCEIDGKASEWDSGNVTNRFSVENYPYE